LSTPYTSQPNEVVVLAGQFSRTNTNNRVFFARSDQFTRTDPTRPPLDIVKEVLDYLGVQGDFVTYAILVFNKSNQLVTVITDALQGSFTDVVNGGSSSGTFQCPKSFIDVGWLDYDFRVQFYLNDSIDPWYDGYISEFDQTQDSDEYDRESVTVLTDGWSTFMSRAIVTETLSPGVQSNGVDNGIEYADEYLIHLTTTYLDSEHFGNCYIASIPIGLDEISFDGTGLDQCIDTVVKQVLNETGNLFEWWVRGTRYGLPQLIIQPQQNPALQTTSYYTPARKIATTYYPEFKDSTMYDYSIQNSAADLANQIALYGGQDPATGLTVYGPFKDSTSISLYGLRQKQVTDTSLVSTASLANYATAYLIMNGYPQPQGSYKKFAPTDAMRSGLWLQIMEPGLQDDGQTFIIDTTTPASMATRHPGNVKQVRVISVTTMFGQSSDGDRVEQQVSFTAPRPFIDQAYYAAVGSATTKQQTQQSSASNTTKVAQTYLQAGLDYQSNDATVSPPTVTISAPTGVFGGASSTATTGSAPVTLPLQDGSSGESGDGTYHLVFAANESESFGTGASGPALHVVKGLPPSYSDTILPGWRFAVQNGKIIGNKDVRVQGGIGTNNYQAASIPASAFQDSALVGVAVTSLNALKGDVVLESTDSSVTITTSGQNINLHVDPGTSGVASLNSETGALTLDSPDSSISVTNAGTAFHIENNGVKSIQSATGAVTFDSPDSSVTITESGGVIHLEAAGGSGGVTSLEGETGVVTFNSPDSSVSISASGGVISLEATGGGGGGVTSLEGATGAITFNSPDSSVTISESGGVISLEATGGGVSSIAGETGAVTLGSSDSSVTITPTTGHIDLKASGGGGGSTFPFTVVQEAAATESGGSSITVPFSQAAAGSENTLIAAFSYDARASGPPSAAGWTTLASFAQANYAAVAILSKESAGETSVTFSNSGIASTIAAWIGEFAGTRSLDTYATLGNTSPLQVVPMPAISPTAGAAVFAMACVTTSGSSGTGNPFLVGTRTGAGWTNMSIPYSNTWRPLCLASYNGPAPGGAIATPAFVFGDGFYSSSASAAMMFSIV
jgi:hypothetical protein